MKLSKFNKELKKEFDSTFQEEIEIKETISLKKILIPIISIASLVILLAGFLIGEHIGVKIYNDRVQKEYDEYYNEYYQNYTDDNLFNLEDNSLIKIESEKEYNVINKTINYTKKESIIDNIIGIFDGFNSSDMLATALPNENIGAPEQLPSNAPMATTPVSSPVSSPSIDDSGSIDTNIQEEGIDEADIAKCDGMYIYYYSDFNLYIYDLKGKIIVKEMVIDESNKGDILNTSINIAYYYRNIELLIKDDKIIIFSNNVIQIYKFENNKLTSLYKNRHSIIVDSRLIDNTLYYVAKNELKEKNLDYDNLYYDGYSKINNLYSIIKINLEDMTINKVQNLNSGSVNLYMSDSYIMLATNVFRLRKVDPVYAVYKQCHLTLVTIFDHNLNALGVIKKEGTVTNQYFMDEKDDYFRIVTVNNSASSSTSINTLSIYDLNTLKLVGKIDEGIGLPNQTARSVRFEGDRCFVVTYRNTDPLYEIDMSDPKNPYIVSALEAPGYSTYLHTFTIGDDNYLFGLGFTDSGEHKISIYKDDIDNTQIGDDFVISYYVYNEADYEIDYYYDMFSNHKAYRIYSDGEYLYIGFNVQKDKYLFVKIDVNNTTDTIEVYKEFEVINETRSFIIDNKIYIPNQDNIIIESFS